MSVPGAWSAVGSLLFLCVYIITQIQILVNSNCIIKL
nr:MAG TPA: hypothetical protein [Caudoviricetes sp.]